MKGILWFQITLTLVLIAGAGAGLYALIKSLDPGTLKLIVGFLLALTTIVVVGLLYAGKDALQVYLVRRHERDNDLRDTQRIAHLSRLARAPRLEAPALMAPPEFSGSYRNTLIDGKVEIE